MLSVVVANASMVTPLIRPATRPTTPIRARGTSLIMVVETWNLPASLGERELRAYSPTRYSAPIAICVVDMGAIPKSVQVYCAETHARVAVRDG